LPAATEKMGQSRDNGCGGKTMRSFETERKTSRDISQTDQDVVWSPTTDDMSLLISSTLTGKTYCTM